MHGDIKIESPIAVVIGKGNAAAIGIQGNAQRIGYIGEMPILIFVIQIGLAPICHIEIEVAIVVKIAPYRASALSIVGEAQLRRAISEHAIALICIEPVIRAKIGDKQIQVAIVVIIAPRRAKTRPFIDGIKTIFYGREARAIVAKEAVGTAICQKQIEVPIVVVIAPGGLNPTFRIPQPQAIGQFGKTVAIILIKAIRAKIGDVEIEIPIAVIIAPSRAISIPGIVNTHRRCHIGKSHFHRCDITGSARQNW